MAQAPLFMLGTYEVLFSFQSVKGGHTDTQPIQNPPVGTQETTIALQAFNVEYIDKKQFGFGALQVDVSLGNARRNASCKVTLRDDTGNRTWEGTARALVTFFGTKP